MGIITWGDIRRGTLAIVLVIVPTVLLATYLTIPLQTYRITGKSLWDLKKLQQVPDAVIEPLLKLRFKSYYSEYRLMNEIESSISDPALYKKYKKEIEGKIDSKAMPGLEYIILAVLATYYGLLWFVTRKWFPDGKI